MSGGPGSVLAQTAPSTTEETIFFIDSYGERPPQHRPAQREQPRLRDLDSSEDEVVFSGRQNANLRGTNARVSPHPTQSRIAVQIVDDDVQFSPSTSPENSRAIADIQDATTDTPDLFIGLSTKRQNKKAQRRKKKNKKSLWNDDEVFADYVRNVARNENAANLSSDDEDHSASSPTQEEKAKFRMSSTLEIVEESSMQVSEEIDDSDSDSSSSDEAGFDDDDDDSDDSSMLDNIISQIRRGESRSELRAHWATSNSMSLDLLEGERQVDFDIVDMQQDGPLRKKKKKKGRRQMDFGLSDSDLELRIEQSWENDRDKKKARKREREQLRAQGLLGKNKRKFDKRGNDKSGITIETFKTDLRVFLLQSHSDSLDLPPMRKHQRKIIHQLASSLNLNSKSRGNGNARFPVLYKTGRTPNFNGKNSVKLDKILAQPRFNLRQSNRMSANERSSPAPKNNRRRQTTNMGASYLEGEVVGGSAPEIGVENKGRAMLEKMGWSSGTALGALNNKGILQPVVHVVKNTRAGLG